MTFFRAVTTVILLLLILGLVMMSSGDMIANTLAPMAISATQNTNLYGIPQTIVVFFGVFMTVLLIFFGLLYIPLYMVKREDDRWRRM